MYVVRALLLAVLIAGLSSCQTLGYYAHVASGHADLVARRQPLERAIDDPAHSPAVRAQLAELFEAREFAIQRLGLPDNRSYTHYVALDRPFVAWNVMAAPELSLQPLLHCFPFAGCVPYRGYFDPERAQRYAATLRHRGLETHVAGTPAYSTLGWFADPVLSSMLRRDADSLVGTVFHELTHQKLYVRGDSAFNESLATFVERQGLHEWRALRGKGSLPPVVDYRPVIRRVLALRDRLQAIYDGPGDDVAKRQAKAAAIEDFRADYARWRETEGSDRPAYDDWVAAPIDNAKLLPFGLYDHWVPAFEALFEESDSDWASFHARAAELASMPKAVRSQRLAGLRDSESAIAAPDLQSGSGAGRVAEPR